MRVITEPTVLPEGEDCEAILGRMVDDEEENSARLCKVLQEAFNEGRKFEASQVAPVMFTAGPKSRDLSREADSVEHAGPSNPLEALGDIALIMDEGPSDPIERFQYDQTPTDEKNVALWESQLLEALKYAARIHTG